MTRTILCFTGLLVAAASACAPASTPPPAGAGAGPPAPVASAPAAAATAVPLEPLRVVYVTLNGAMGPLWVAQEAGIYARHGIAAELRYISSGTLGMQALLANEVDIGVIAASSAIAANLNGGDAMYFGAIQRTFGLWIYAGDEVATPADLKGKRVGITRRGSTTEIALSYYLDKVGLAAERDVAVVELGEQSAMVPALKTGAVQAAVVSDPTTIYAQRDGFRELADLTQLGVEYPQSALSTRRSFATERPELVMRFLRAVVEATHHFKTNRELGLRVLAQYFQTDDRELLATVYANYAGRLVQDVPRANYEGARTVLGELAATNARARDADPAQFLDLRFLEALDRETTEPGR